MKKIQLFLVTLLIVVTGANASLRQMQMEIVDEFWQPITDITQISVFDAGTSSATTIYADRAGAISVTNPITTSSTNSTFDQATGVVRWYQRAPDYKVTITDGTKVLTLDSRNSTFNRFPWYANYIGTAASLTVGDNQSIGVGDDGPDAELSWVNASDILNWIPAVDGVAFNIGSTTATKQFDFNSYVGGIGGGGLSINEGTSAFTWLSGGAFTVNATGAGTTAFHGAGTGTIAIGSGTSGAWSIDGTAGGTINADDSLAVTVSAGTIGIAATGGDLTIDATDKSVIIRGTEAASDAVLIDADAGSIDIDSADNITVDAADDVTIDTAEGKIHLIADGTTAGDITLDAEDDIILITTGKLTITNTGAVEMSGAMDILGTITMAEDEVISNAVDDTVSVTSNDEHMTFNIMGATSNKSAILKLEADLSADAADTWTHTVADGGAYTIANEGTATLTISEAVTISGTLTAAGINHPVVEVGDNTAYDVLAANSGKVHVIPDLTGDLTMDLPTEAAGLYYKFVYVGGAEDAQDWIIDSEVNTNFFTGGLNTFDDDDTGATPVYSDNTANYICTVLTPGTGTEVEIWCDGTIWFINGTVVSSTATSVVFSGS